MKINISSLMTLISEEEKNFSNYSNVIKTQSYNISIQELNGTTNILEDNKDDFDITLKKIEETNQTISKLKALLYEKNNSFKLSDGRSIQQAIVDNNNLRRLKVVYEDLLLNRSTKVRHTEVNNSYFETKTINYNPKDLQKRVEEIEKNLRETDFEISKLNSIEFEI